MRADERQAAVAYAYAWWMTGDDDAAATVLRTAMAAPEPAGGDDARLVALTTAVRSELGDLRPMPPASELALLVDGFGVPLEAAAELAGVGAAAAPDHLAHGRLEALLETVREDFRHPERLGGLATGNEADLEHAEQCRSCGRARTLIERGSQELREVSAVSAPAGLIPGLVAQHAPPPEVVEAETVETEHGAVETEADIVDIEPGSVDAPDAPAAPENAAAVAAAHVETPSVEELEAMLQDAPADAPAVAPADVDDAPVEIDLADQVAPEAPPTEPEAPEPTPEAPESPHKAPETKPQAPPADRVPTTPARRRAAGVFAVAGVVALCGLVVALVVSSAPDEAPQVNDVTEQPAIGAAGESDPPRPERSERPFGPRTANRRGFSVAAAGLLLSGNNELAPSGTTIGQQDPLRVAVDYENATKGVNLVAIWRVDGKLYRRLEAVVSSRESRHVWGMPVPEGGWKPGRHRIVVTADDSVAAAIDFTVRQGD